MQRSSSELVLIATLLTKQPEAIKKHNSTLRVCVLVCAHDSPLRKLSDLGDAHVLVEMFKHIDHSLQKVGHLTVLPFSGHGSGTGDISDLILILYKENINMYILWQNCKIVTQTQLYEQINQALI